MNGQPSATTPKVVGSTLFDPIEMCWVHQLGDAFEEAPFAAIDELEKLDEEEGEGWGTIKVNSPPCELGASVGSTSGLVQLSSVSSNRASWTLQNSFVWSGALGYSRRCRRSGCCSLLDRYHSVRSIEVSSQMAKRENPPKPTVSFFLPVTCDLAWKRIVLCPVLTLASLLNFDSVV